MMMGGFSGKCFGTMRIILSVNVLSQLPWQSTMDDRLCGGMTLRLAL